VAGPAARIPGPSPNATNGAISCATRREAWVTGLDCGVGVGATGTRSTHRAGGGGHISLNARGVLALFPPRGPNRGTGTSAHAPS
jgi:hypothetical protein